MKNKKLPPLRLKLTISIEYNAVPEHYDTDDPFKMADIDQSNFRNNIQDAFELLDTEGAKIEVSVVQRKIKFPL